MSFVFVAHAFIITTNVQQALQYLKRSVFTSDGTIVGTVLVDINTGAAGGTVWAKTTVETPSICALGGTSCKDVATLTTASTLLTTSYLAKATGPTQVAPSIIYDNGTQVAIGTTTPVSGAALTVQKGLAVSGSIQVDTFCNFTGTVCRQMTDFASYMTGNVANNYIAKGQNAALINSIIVDDGVNVGVGRAFPSQKLDVNGGIRVGDTGVAVEGTIRYDATAKHFY